MDKVAFWLCWTLCRKSRRERGIPVMVAMDQAGEQVLGVQERFQDVALTGMSDRRPGNMPDNKTVAHRMSSAWIMVDDLFYRPAR